MANELRLSSVLKCWYLSIARIDCHKASREVHIQFMVETNATSFVNYFWDFMENVGKSIGFVENICIFILKEPAFKKLGRQKL